MSLQPGLISTLCLWKRNIARSDETAISSRRTKSFDPIRCVDRCQVEEQLEAASCVCPLLQCSHMGLHFIAMLALQSTSTLNIALILRCLTFFLFFTCKTHWLYMMHVSGATVCVRTINEELPLWMSSPLSPPPTVSSGGQPYQAGDGHHGSAGVMRERRAAGDPYWSYSGEPPFMLCSGLRSLSVGKRICAKYRFTEEQNGGTVARISAARVEYLNY